MMVAIKQGIMNANKILRYRSSEADLFKHYHVNPEEHFIRIKEYNKQVRVLTTGKGQALLFIHGEPDAGSIWIPLAPHLHNYFCIFIDRPGCGLSDTIKYHFKSVEDISKFTEAVIDSVMDYFQLKEISIVGSSLGGYLSLLYTLNSPHLVKKLVLEGCPAFVEGMNVPTFIKWIIAPVLRWIVPNIPASKSFIEQILVELGHSYSVHNSLVPITFIQWNVCLFNMTNSQKNEIALITQLMPWSQTYSPFTITDLMLSKIKQPALLLWGENDPFGGKQIANRIKEKMKNTDLIIFDNAGHLPWIDDPKLHALKINEFMLADIPVHLP